MNCQRCDGDHDLDTCPQVDRDAEELLSELEQAHGVEGRALTPDRFDWGKAFNREGELMATLILHADDGDIVFCLDEPSLDALMIGGLQAAHVLFGTVYRPYLCEHGDDEPCSCSEEVEDDGSA